MPSTLAQTDDFNRDTRLLAGQKRVLEMVAIGEPLPSVLQAINDMVEAENDEVLCSVLLLDESGKHLKGGAAASLPASYNAAIDGAAIGPNAGSCGTAAFLRERIIVQDVLTDPRWAAYHPLATAHGLRACWSQPIFSRDGDVLGTFAIYYRRVATPDERDLELINTAAHLAGIVLDRQRMDEALRRAKAAAESASAMKDRFLAVVSHELRTPLTPVLAALDLLQKRPDLPADSRADLMMVRRNIDLEARLIDDLLDMTRIKQGKLELRQANADVHKILQATLDVCRNDLADARQSLTLELHAQQPIVWGDPARLQQVFWNLLRNAVKFTPQRGSIILRTHTPADRDAILLDVIDTGMGIEPQTLSRIFSVFEQGQRQITRQFGGLGLGLAISRAIVEMHGGRISAASQGRDRGATFTVELPIHRQPSEGADATATPASRDAIRAGVRVLLVDDHADTLAIIARLLKSMGCTVKSAATVQAAIELLEAGEFDLMISDLGLPDGSGHELVGRARSRGIMSIALSGFGTETDVQRSIEAGFNRHLTKPVSYEELEAAVREVCVR